MRKCDILSKDSSLPHFIEIIRIFYSYKSLIMIVYPTESIPVESIQNIWINCLFSFCENLNCSQNNKKTNNNKEKENN